MKEELHKSSLPRRHIQINWEIDRFLKLFFSNFFYKNFRGVRQRSLTVILMLLAYNMAPMTSLTGSNSKDWSPQVIVHLDTHEDLKEFKPLRITDTFVDINGEEWSVFHYFLLFDEDVTHKGDIEGVTILKKGDTVVVGFWQHGFLVTMKYTKSEIEREGGLHVYFECGMHAALPKPGISTGLTNYIFLGLEETAYLATKSLFLWAISNGNYKLPSFGSTDGKKVIEDIDWNSDTVTFPLEEGITKIGDFLKKLEVTKGSPVTLRYNPLLCFQSDNTKYQLLIESDHEKLISILHHLQPGKEMGGINFTSVQLTYISESPHITSEGKQSTFQYILKAKEAKKGDKLITLENGEALSLIYFLTGLSLPNDTFWVNLNPWEPDRIIDENVGLTDMGRIMLYVTS